MGQDLKKLGVDHYGTALGNLTLWKVHGDGDILWMKNIQLSH